MNFADTGTFLALYHGSDQHHVEAVRLWPTLEPPVLTSNLVLGELGNLLGQRVGFARATERIADIYTSAYIDVVQSTRTDENEAIFWMRKYADQDVSFTDGVSFAIMRRLGVRTAFTFDRHFRLVGFRVIGLK